MKEIKKGKKRKEKEKEGLDKLSFCFQRTNWCSLRGCFETEKSRWETFRGEPDPIELWLVAGVVEERKKKKKKGEKEHRAIHPFFHLSFYPSQVRSVGPHRCGNLRKALRYKLLKLSLVFVGGRDLWRLRHGIFATRPGKAVFHREISLFIGRIESIGCLVILSNRFHAQAFVIFPCFRESLAWIAPVIFIPFSSPPLFLTNTLPCLLGRVKDGTGRRWRGGNYRVWGANKHKRGARQRRRELFSEGSPPVWKDGKFDTQPIRVSNFHFGWNSNVIRTNFIWYIRLVVAFFHDSLSHDALISRMLKIK